MMHAARRARPRRRAPVPGLPVAALLAVLLISACGSGEETTATPGPGEGSAATDVWSDPRLTPLLASCARDDFYDRNVADPLPILMGKLESGQLDPLRRAKEELAAMGEEAVPALRRMIDRTFADPHGFAVLQNALDVVQQSRAAGTRELLLRALDHPSSAVRQRAIQGLRAERARPEDFDRLLLHVEVEDPEQRHVVALALHAADPARAELLYLDWMERGRYPALWPFVVLELPGSDEPATQRRCAELQGQVDLTLRPFLAACAARGGDGEARTWLATQLADPDPTRLPVRGGCIRACGAAGLERMCLETLAGDPDANLRAQAVEVVAQLWPEDGAGEPDPLVRDVLRGALDDVALPVRVSSFGALVRRGDPVAVDRALGKLLESPRQVNEAMIALLPRLETDPELAQRVHATLMERHALEAELPLERRLATLKSLGQIPSAEAARFLRETGLEHAGVVVEGLRAHEWTCLQAANTGEPGRAWLAEQLAEEEDPLRRLDLLWATSAARSDATRVRLLGLLEDPALAPHEVLYVAERLARLGPAAEVAGRIKRAANRIEEPRVRRGLQCLLWTWY